jgi:hypothetical protein
LAVAFGRVVVVFVAVGVVIVVHDPLFLLQSLLGRLLGA